MSNNTTTMLRDFADRDALIAYLRAEFPSATAVDDHVTQWSGGRRAALTRLAAVEPARYGATRNYLDGAVTHLSPYLRHGILSLAEVRDAVLRTVDDPQAASKLIQELGYRDYFQRVYATLGAGIWQDIEAYKTGHNATDYAAELPADIRDGATGLACIDAFVNALYTTGYLHNHMRLWLAAYVVHWRRIRWQTGAQWFLEHLVDGDPASNNLSWQWVASTFSHKPYYFNRENLERFSGGVYCADCPLRGRCDFEASYETLQARLFAPATAEPPATASAAALAPDAQHTTVSEDTDTLALPAADQPLVWVHGDNLNPHQPTLRSYPAAPALWVWDDELLAEWRISLKRILFIYESLLELPVTIQRGNVVDRLVAYARAHGLTTIVTVASPSPRFQSYVAALRATGLHVHIMSPPPFVPHTRRPDPPYDLRRFSRYWRQAQAEAMQPTPP